MLRRTIFVVVLAAFVLPLAVGAQPAQAQGNGYTTHMVKPGETLYSIAGYYGVSAAAIAKANDLYNPDYIYAGQQLVIPGSGMPDHGGPGWDGGHDGGWDGGHDGPGWDGGSAGSHVVQPGETLYSIAMDYGTSVNAIVRANGLANENVIFIGQVLVIPGGGYGPKGDYPVYYPPKGNYDGGYGGCGNWVSVHPGDSLSGIAARMGSTTYAIAGANGLHYPYIIYSGQSLYVPCPDGGYYPPAGGYHARYDGYDNGYDGHGDYGHKDGHPAPKSDNKNLKVAACPREIQIVRPYNKQHISGVQQIIGTADIPDFQFYKIEYAAGFTPLDSSFISINGEYTQKIVDGALTTWYTGNVPSGDYTLRLTAVDKAGQFPRPCDVQVHVD